MHYLCFFPDLVLVHGDGASAGLSNNNEGEEPNWLHVTRVCHQANEDRASCVALDTASNHGRLPRDIPMCSLPHKTSRFSWCRIVSHASARGPVPVVPQTTIISAKGQTSISG